MRRWRSPLLALFPCLLAACLLSTAPGAAEANSEGGLERELKTIARAHSRIVHLESLCESADGREVWRLELGAGSDDERAQRPALLVVAGTEGLDPVGEAAAVQLARRLAEGHADHPERLQTTTVHVVPRWNPDAVASAFASPRWQTASSLRPFDDDHDGFVDEDGGEDLNGDGLVTWMRVEDDEGDHVPDPREPRLLVPADAARGETGTWRYLPEGVDDDGDERWSEDGPGGVNFNRNFPHGYAWFAADAGVHQVSEAETRAAADFLVAHPNIGLVVTYGTNENVAGTPKAGKKPEGARAGAGGGRSGRGRGFRQRRQPPTAVDADDRPFLEKLGESYREALGFEEAEEAVTQAGSLADWVYFHRGRLALATRGWTPARQRAIEEKAESDAEKEKDEDDGGVGDESGDATSAAGRADEQVRGSGRRGRRGGSRRGGGGGDDDEKRNEDDRELLKWLDEHHPEGFVAWQSIEHPDFPGQRVEVGGFAPYARVAPPDSSVAEHAGRHADWLESLLEKLPRVGLQEVEVEHLGTGVFELTIRVENSGYLPTVLAHGVVTREVHPTRLVVDLPDEAFLAGARRTTLSPLAGSGGMQEVRLVVHSPARRSVRVQVISALGGRAETTFSLEGGRR